MSSESIRTFDNTALNAFQTCQKKYQYFIEDGVVPETTSEPLAFGISLHAGREHYQRLRMSGVPHLDANDEAVKKFESIWDKEIPDSLKTPLKSGDRRGKTNGGRLLRGYLAKYGEFGKPLHIEVPFACFLGKSADGEPVLVSGILDEICEYQGQTYVLDLKTTTYEPDARFFESFRTSSAMMGYIFAVEETLGIQVAGVMIHAIWVRNIHYNKPRKVPLQDHFRANIITYTPEQLDEWKTNVLYTVEDIKTAKSRGYYRFNWGDACKNYGGCEYKSICGATPANRKTLIANNFRQSRWDPLGLARSS